MTGYKFQLPAKGTPPQDVLKKIDELRALDPPFERGPMTAYCMRGSRELQDLAHRAYGVYFFQNAVVRRYLPGLLKMEEEVRDICAGILSGGQPGIRINFTTGGSESLFCAMHAIREWGRTHHPGISRPQIIAPYSAHATISKACHYLGIELKRVPVGPDYRADVQEMRQAIGPNTIGLIGSAPSWPYGKIDPIAELGALAEERGLWLHVDACVGGYLAPFVARAGYPVPPWDFSVPGVTSISADLHKYGYAPKPASTIAFRSEELQQFHNVHPDDWPSMKYVSEGLVGSRPAGAIAAVWAVFQYMGQAGYLDFAKRTMKAKEKLMRGLRELGMKPWDTELCILLYDTGDVPAEKVAGGLIEAGWPCMGTQRPALVQLVIDPLAEEAIEPYLAELAKVLAKVREGAATNRVSLGYAE